MGISLMVHLFQLWQFRSYFVFLGKIHTLRGHWKSTFARNFKFLTPSPPFSSLFVSHVHPPSITYVGFSELPNATFMNFWVKKLWVKRKKRIFFCKLSIKDQCFWQSYILLCLIVGAGVKLQILGKTLGNSFNYYCKRMT